MDIIIIILVFNVEEYIERSVHSLMNQGKYSMEVESIKNEWLKDYIQVEFEEDLYPIIKNYDAYLTHLYGDYMTPPPVDKRIAEHLEIVKNK